MSNFLTVTHVFPETPQVGVAVPLRAVCRNPDDESFFVQGLKSEAMTSAAVCDAVESSLIVRLKYPVHLQSDERIFLQDDGQLVVAKSVDGPYRDKNRRVVDILELKDRRRIQRFNNLGILNKLGIRAEETFDEELPKEVEAAFQNLEDAMTSDEERTLGYCSAPLLVAGGTYLKMIDQGLQDLQESLSDIIFNVAERDDQGCAPLRPEQAEHDIYQALLVNQEERQPIILTFPFFWSEPLRKRYGVLPYGRQTQVGMILSRRGVKLNRNFDWGQTISLDEGLDVLIGALKSKAGHIYAFYGYIFEDIARRLVADYVNRNRARDKTCANFLSQFRVRLKRRFRRETLNAGTVKRCLSDQECFSVILVDPGERNEIQKACKRHPELTYVVCNHGLNVPVGIGFTYYALPFLLKNRTWRKLLNSVDVELAKLVTDLAMFAQCGIELDLDVLPSTRTARIDSLRSSETPISRRQRQPEATRRRGKNK